MAVVVVKRTRLPCAQAAKQSAVATCVLPVPGLPTMSTFSLLLMYSPLIKSRTRAWLIEGWALKSKVSIVLTTGRFVD